MKRQTLASHHGAYILVEEMDNKLVNNYRAWHVLLEKKSEVSEVTATKLKPEDASYCGRNWVL